MLDNILKLNDNIFPISNFQNIDIDNRFHEYITNFLNQ
jgi:hypothetical protein